MGVLTWLRHRNRVWGAPRNALPMVFSDNEEFFEYQCAWADTRPRPMKPIAALVERDMTGLSARLGLGVAEGQEVALTVASASWGMATHACACGPGEPLHPGDLVIWVPTMLHPITRKWIGAVVAKIAPEIHHNGVTLLYQFIPLSTQDRLAGKT